MIIAVLAVLFLGASGGAVATVQNPELHKFVQDQVIAQDYLKK